MIIAATNLKGGVGKSTIAVHLAVYLQQSGKNVLVVDCDMQRSCSRWLDRMGSGLITERITDPDEIDEHVPKLAQQVDVVVADGPAGTDELTRALLMVCDLALVPCGPSPLDLEASQLAVRVIRQARAIRKGDLPRALFVPNKLQANTTLSTQLLEVPNVLDEVEEQRLFWLVSVGFCSALPKPDGRLSPHPAFPLGGIVALVSWPE